MRALHRGGRNAQGFKRTSVRPGSGAIIRVDGVEGWRGPACLLVVVTHVWTNMGTGGVGPGYDHPAIAWIFGNIDIVVDLFFVLSGLLLWLPFARAAFDDDVDVPHPGHFLLRRCLRLLPVYWLVVAVCWFTRNYGVATADWKDLVIHLGLLQSFDSRVIFFDVGPAWTLSIEWIFYLSLTLLGPPFVRWVRRGGARPARVRRMVLGCAAAIWLSVLFKANVAWVWRFPADDWAWRFGPAAKADTFAIGMLLAVAVVLLRGRTLHPLVLPACLALGVGLYALVAVPPGADHNLHAQVLRHTVGATSFALLLFGITTCRWRSIPAAIDNALLVRLSLIAYCVYLVHEPLLLVVRDSPLWNDDPTVAAYTRNLAIVVAIVLVAAWSAHRLVEEPWCDLGALRDKRARRIELYPHLLDGTPGSGPDPAPTPFRRPLMTPSELRPRRTETVGALREQVLARVERPDTEPERVA